MLDRSKIKKILIINFGGIGDVLLSQPALKALKRYFFDSRVFFLGIPRTSELIKDFPYIDEARFFYKDHRYLLHNLKVLFELRKNNFDLAINMRTIADKFGSLMIRLIFGFINPKIKAGRDTSGRGYFFDIRIPEEDIGKKYEIEYDLELVRTLGVDEIIEREIDFFISPIQETEVKRILEREKILDSDILVGIHPGGKPSHRWPIENFALVIEELSKQIDCKFAITADKNEIKLVKELIDISRVKPIDLSGRFSLKELAVFIKRCNLFICNDTAPMHIAAIIKVPLIAIFGPGDLERFDPRKISSKATVFYRKTDCAPCNKLNCKSKKCLKRILPEEIIEEAIRLLKNKAFCRNYS
ncbi:MAG: glycosyltransferase family 9 protein [Candidatus Omnitrophica bacterium]|nr:glycosyltransferase family 9 protein [Candidatus Omnitrophota bacterium]